MIPQVKPYFDKHELKNIKRCLKDKWITEGHFAKEFRDKIQELTKAKYVILAPNGTLALYLSMVALGIKKDDKAIVPDFTFNATASPLHFLGASPVFVDINRTLCIDPEKIESSIRMFKPTVKTIIPVHIFGISADMTPIMKIAKKHKLDVLEDAAQGLGVTYDTLNKHVGTIGDIGIISFFTDKTITTGEGACILTNNDELNEKLTSLRNQGRETSGSFLHPSLGMNFRMTDLQCAIGCAQMDKFEEIKQKKLENYFFYLDYLEDLDKQELNIMKPPYYSNNVPFRVAIRFKDEQTRLKVQQNLERNGVQTRQFFYPLHKQPCWAHLRYEDDFFEETISAYEQGLLFPVYPGLKKMEIEFTCMMIKEALR
jgi:perosamine synthetase